MERENEWGIGSVGASKKLGPGVSTFVTIVRLDAKRRLTVPAGLATASPGDCFDARLDADEDALVFRRSPRKESWFTVLKACSVSPDDAPRRRRAPARRPLRAK